MRNTEFSQILFESLQYSGNDRHNINDETFAQFRDFASARMREVWESQEFPDLIRLTTFTVTTDTAGVTYFTPLATAGEVLGVFDKNPQITSRALDLKYEIYDLGTSVRVILPSGLFTTGFYSYRTKFIPLTGTIWKATDVYYQNAQIYFDSGSAIGTYVPVTGKPHSGDFYYCTVSSTTAGSNPSNNPTQWTKISIPYIFGNYMAWGMAANFLISEGKIQEGAGLEQKADMMIAIEVDKYCRQQNQTRKINFTNPYA